MMNTQDIAQLCQKTPNITVLDNRGLTVRQLQFNRTTVGGELDTRITRHTYNAAGHLQTSIDPRFFDTLADNALARVQHNLKSLTSLSGKPLNTDSIDAGKRVNLTDITGASSYEWDERGTTRRYQYDTPLHRPVAVHESNPDMDGSEEYPVQRLIYGDATGSNDNLNGQLVQHYDHGGLTVVESISLTGQVLSETRQLLLNPEGEAHWQGDINDWQVLLDQDTYRTRWQYNSLGALVQQVDAKDNQQRLSYYVSGHLQASYLTPAVSGASEQTIVSKLTYSATGQKLKEVAGNGVTTTYHYEPETQRLLNMTTTRPQQNKRAPALIQDLLYVYDPVGNITDIEDRASLTRFFKNQRVAPSNAYQYDALYQLVQASGRENSSNGQQNSSLPTAITPIPTDNNQYVNYSRNYSYDRGGNLNTMQHTGSANYTNTMVISDNSNRALQQNTSSSITPADVDGHFDLHGNLTILEGNLGGNKTLSWDKRDQLLNAQLTSNQQENYQYAVQGQRIRKTFTDAGTDKKEQTIYLPGLELRRKYNTNGEDVLTEDLQVITIGEAGRCQVRMQHWAMGKPADESDIADNQLRYSIDNHIGSSNIELDDSATIVSQEEYYPYGGTAVWSSKSNTEAKYKVIRYSGKERDATGLYYYGYRYYMPWMGKWLNPDPAGTVDGLNIYAFVGNNPMVYRDLEGLARTKAKPKAAAKALPVTKRITKAQQQKYRQNQHTIHRQAIGKGLRKGIASVDYKEGGDSSGYVNRYQDVPGISHAGIVTKKTFDNSKKVKRVGLLKFDKYKNPRKIAQGLNSSSKNHILSDHGIQHILMTAKDKKNNTGLLNWMVSLSDKKVGQDAFNLFNANAHWEQSYKMISVHPTNVRIGDSEINQAVGSAFDPAMTIGGNYTAAATGIKNATAAVQTSLGMTDDYTQPATFNGVALSSSTTNYSNVRNDLTKALAKHKASKG